MRRTLGIAAVVLALLAPTLAGCNGEGIFTAAKIYSTDGGDTPDPDDGGTDPPDPIPDTTRSLGTWITSYSDARVESGARYGQIQYAVSANLRRNGTDLTGTGTVFRIFSEGPTAQDELSVRFTGFITGDDANLAVSSATGGRVYDAPTWQLRFAGSQAVGMYVSYDSNRTVVRSGRAVWFRQGTGDIAQSWASAYSDEYGGDPFPAYDRTALMLLEKDAANNVVTGLGSFVEQRDGDTPFNVEFDVADGLLSGSRVEWTYANLSLANTPVDWFGFLSNGILVGAYGQFDQDDALVRFGHAAWYVMLDDFVPDGLTGTWITSFTDQATDPREPVTDYLMAVSLRARSDNIVTGSGQLLTSEMPLESELAVSVNEGVITGSKFAMETRVNVPNDRFVWDLRANNSVMVGSYQRFTSGGRFLGRGTAEWRRQTTATPSVRYTWVGSYHDTENVTSQGPQTQMAIMNVAIQTTDGALDGTGALRYGNGENRRRLFDLLDGSVLDQDIRVTWGGPDLFGDTRWRFRQAGSRLYGVYYNETSSGAFESRGSAVFIRTSTQSVF